MSLEVGWKILHLVWWSKGIGGKGVPDLIQKACPNVAEGLAYQTINTKVKEDRVAPPEVAEYVIDRMPVREGCESRAEVVRLGVAAWLGRPLPEGSTPAQVAQDLRAAFPDDEVATKLAEALAKQEGPLDTLRAKLEARLSAFASSILSKLDALASRAAGKLDALACTVVSGLATLATAVMGIRSALDVVNGKLDRILGSLGVVAATVDDVNAKEDLAHLAREREHRSLLWAVGGLVGLLGVVFLGGVAVLLASGRLAWAHREDTNSATTASVAQTPAPLVVIVNGATGTMINLRAYLGAVLEMGKKEENWIPKEPLPFQKLAKDCKASLGETVINGGCWVQVGNMAPPCGEIFRYGNACYRPVSADPTKPVGLFPDQR